MPELLIMRHAKSAWNTTAADHDRPLAPRGERDAPEMADWIALRGLAPDRVWTSSALRARSTALAVVERCAVDPAAVVIDERFYHASSRTWVDAMRGCDGERLLICGHNPTFDDLVETLSDREPPLTLNGKLMTTAAVAHLRVSSWRDLAPGVGEFLGIFRPKEL